MLANSITAVNISAAALITQFSLGLILSISAFILRGDDETRQSWERPLTTNMPWIVLGFTLLTTGALFFSDPYSTLWKPLLGDLGVPSIDSSTALLIALQGDIYAVFFLTFLTGGATSPFTPVFFILPALAIFLRENLSRLLYYVVLISILFTVGVLQDASSMTEVESRSRRRIAYWFVSSACFVLATFVGYVTRPR